MAGRGPTPYDAAARSKRAKRPARDWKYATATGWQHGEIPDSPQGLMPASVVAWSTWFSAWFAAFWLPADVPALRQVIRLYDQVERGEFQRASELRLYLDTFGISPKGQQDRRWRPQHEGSPAPVTPMGNYEHLRQRP